MAPLVLYTHDLSPPASSINMLANLLELEIEKRPVNLHALEHKSEQFKKINPMGTIPVLVDGDFYVSESHVILKYLLEKYGGEHRERLYPSEVRVRSLVDTCMFFNAGVFFVRMKVVALPTFLESLSAPSPRQLEDIDIAYGVVEEYLRRHKFAAAEHVTLADLSLAATAAPMQAIRKIESKKCPRLLVWLARLEQEPWYRGPSTACVTSFTAALEKAWTKNNQRLKMARLVLYTNKASPPASSINMLANLIGLEIEARHVNLLGLEHKSEDYIEMNPMGTVPVLVDGDLYVSESHAILKYLLEKYGGEHRERLYPSDVRVRSLVDTCMFFNAGVFFVRLKAVALPSFLECLRGPSPRQLEDIDLAYEVVEEYLRRHKFVAADHVTLADLSLATTAASMQAISKIDSNRFPRLLEWLARLEQEPWYREISATCVTTFTAALQAAWKKNNQ